MSTEKKKAENSEGDKNDTTEKKKEKPAPPLPPPKPRTFAELFRAAVDDISAGVAGDESRLINRGLRFLPRLRRKTNPQDFCRLVELLVSNSSPSKARLLEKIEFVKNNCPTLETGDVKMADVSSTASCGEGVSAEKENTPAPSPSPPTGPSLNPFAPTTSEIENAAPEILSFISVCICDMLLDVKNYDEAQKEAEEILRYTQDKSKRRTLDPIVAKLNFVLSRIYECQGRLPEIRSRMLGAYRTAVLHNDIEGQAMSMNLVLRNYVQSHLYSQAEKFVSRTVYPENLRNNAQHARYLYYLGKTRAMQLQYSEAYRLLTQALRKAPQQKGAALGFRLSAYRLCIVVELLTGDIPERAIFEQPYMKAPLRPYLATVQAVRSGNLASFKSVVAEYEDRFRRDGTLVFIHRLQSNVVKAGLRWVNLAYRRIKLTDIAKKLNLDAALDVESVVAKNIADGVIEATIDNTDQVLISRETPDVYNTDEPLKAYHKRTTFCLQLHNDAVKALEYPKEVTNCDIAEAENRRMREQELLERSESDVEDDDDVGFF